MYADDLVLVFSCKILIFLLTLVVRFLFPIQGNGMVVWVGTSKAVR